MPKSKRGTGARVPRASRNNPGAGNGVGGGGGGRPQRPGHSGSGGSNRPSLSSLILAQSPLVYWQLNETAGTTASDSSGNGRNGTIVGSPAFNATFVDGTLGINFDAVDDKITLTDAAWMDVTNITIICFHNTNANAAHRVLASRDRGSGQVANDRIWIVEAISNAGGQGVIDAFTNNAVGPIKGTLSTNAWQTGTWKGFGWKQSSAGAISFFIDTAKDSDQSGGFVPFGNGIADLVLGCTQDNQAKYLGAIRHFAMFGTVLSDSTIINILTRGLQP